MNTKTEDPEIDCTVEVYKKNKAMSRLQEVVEVAEKKLPGINKKIETITFKLFDASLSESCEAFSKQISDEDVKRNFYELKFF